MSVLHLTQQKKWFDMTAEGIKKEEYRQIKPYWVKRLIDIVGPPEEEKGQNRNIPDNIAFDLFWHPLQQVLKDYYSKLRSFDLIVSRNGYSNTAPKIAWKHMGIRIGTPNPEWCPTEFHGHTFFILEISQIIK
jgi:hypothetical protein